MTGDMLGTLRYMSPEQAAGNRRVLDHRTDIYSLGVTLYELADPAAGLRRRTAASGSAARSKAPTRPPAATQPPVPRDLETIILQAMAKSPQDRYATAQELADDLRRFVEDEPIEARRPLLAERAGKWIRRHRGLLTAVLAVMLLTVVGLVIALVEIATQRSEAVNARNTAWEQRQFARQAVDEMYSQVAEEWLAEQPGLTAVQRKFLERSMEYYQTFRGRRSRRGGDVLRGGQGLPRCGDVQLEAGRSACRTLVSQRDPAAFSINLSKRSPLPATIDRVGQVGMDWRG